MLVLTTCGSVEEAEKLATTLVRERRAACVNRISGVSSTYRWQGRVQTDQETLLLIKTTEDRLASVEATIASTAGYELPECIALRVETGSAAYLEWLAGAVADA